MQGTKVVRKDEQPSISRWSELSGAEEHIGSSLGFVGKGRAGALASQREKIWGVSFSEDSFRESLNQPLASGAQGLSALGVARALELRDPALSCSEFEV